MSQILRRMSPVQMKREAEITAARIALEVGVDVPAAATVTSATLPGDARRLRGIPLFPAHGGICGTMAESSPEGELIRNAGLWAA